MKFKCNFKTNCSSKEFETTLHLSTNRNSMSPSNQNRNPVKNWQNDITTFHAGFNVIEPSRNALHVTTKSGPLT